MLNPETFEMSQEMKVKYLERRRHEVINLKKMAEFEKIEPAQRMGHQMAGSAASFGFFELEPIARELEKLKSQDFEKCKALIEILDNMIHQAMQKFGTNNCRTST